MKKFLILLFALVVFNSHLGVAAGEEREFQLEKTYFDWVAEELDYYPFTPDLQTIDEGIAGEYSYHWSIGLAQPRHVIQAACLIDYNRVLLAWWRSKERATRVTALAVFYGTRKADISTFPNFEKDLERFGREEARERREELVFVKANRAFFRTWLRDLTEDTLPKDSQFLKALQAP